MDNTNASYIKVLHIGQPSNILKELKMTANEYNWVASIYGVRYALGSDFSYNCNG